MDPNIFSHLLFMVNKVLPDSGTLLDHPIILVFSQFSYKRLNYKAEYSLKINTIWDFLKYE